MQAERKMIVAWITASSAAVLGWALLKPTIAKPMTTQIPMQISPLSTKETIEPIENDLIRPNKVNNNSKSRTTWIGIVCAMNTNGQEDDLQDRNDQINGISRNRKRSKYAE